MRSFMSAFAAFAIKSAGYKKKVANPVKREKYIEKLRAKNEKPFNIIPFPYKSKPEKTVKNGTELITFNKGKEKLIIYLHGGAYCEQPLLPHFVFCDRAAVKTDSTVYMPVYKKSPNYTFEETYAFLEGFYRELLDVTEPERITFMGDSSGGGLALAFCEYLNEIGLPQPKRMILLSPWVDISMDTPFPTEIDVKDPSLQREFLQEVGKNWAGGTDVHDYRLSPTYGKLENLAPMTVYYGTYEAFLPDAHSFRDKCAAAGAQLDYREWEKMNHCFPIYPTPEAAKAQKEIFEILNS